MKRAMLGDVEISVIEGDNPTESVEVTEKPVERGEDIADHVRRKPSTISISGIIVGEDASPKLERLKKYQREGEILTYVNRVAYPNMVIENINTTHDTSIGNGFKISITLKRVRIATAKEVNIKSPPAPIKSKEQKPQTPQTSQTPQVTNKNKSNNNKAVSTKARNTGNGGRKQPKEKTPVGPRIKLTPQEQMLRDMESRKNRPLSMTHLIK